MSLMSQLGEAYTRELLKKHEGRMRIVEEFYPQYSDDAKKITLCQMLENTGDLIDRAANAGRIYESTQVANIKDGLKHQYFDIITAAFPGLISEDLFSVQPLRQKVGQIFFLDYVYGSNKGKIKKGDTIFSNLSIAGYEGNNYTGEVVDGETVGEGDGTQQSFSGNLNYLPITPGSVVITAETVVAKDNGEGVLSGTGVTGTIDYNTGAYTLTYTTAPADEAPIEAVYEYDLSYAPSTIPALDLKVREQTITARPRKLKATYSLDAAYDLQQAQGINIDTAIQEAAANQLRHELDGTFIINTYNQAGLSKSWTNAYNAADPKISKKDYYELFIEALYQASSAIFQATKRVRGNWVVVGKTGADILKFIGAPRFISAGDSTSVGPHFAGTLDNEMKVYYNPFFGDNQFMVGYKGGTLVDAGKIIAPYLPFFSTQIAMLEDFVGRRGFASSYGEKLVNSNLFVKGTIV